MGFSLYNVVQLLLDIKLQGQGEQKQWETGLKGAKLLSTLLLQQFRLQGNGKQ